MTSLYALTQQALALEEMLNSLIEEGDEGDLSLQVQEILNHGSQVHEDWVQKIDDTFALVRVVQVDIEGINSEIERLQNLKNKRQQMVDALKLGIKEAMKSRGVKKLRTPRFSVSVAGCGGLRPIEVAVPAHKLPERFQKTKIEPNMKAIREALEGGEVLDCATLLDRSDYLKVQ